MSYPDGPNVEGWHNSFAVATKTVTNHHAAREKNALLDYSFAHRTVQRDTSTCTSRGPNVKPPLGAAATSCVNSTKDILPKQKHTIYIQNSSTLAKREQEMLKQSALARVSSQGTATTHSLTTTMTLSVTSGSQNTLHTTFDSDNVSGLEASDECLPEDGSSIIHALQSFDEESSADDDDEGSADDEREWKRDGILMDILREASDEDKIYEDIGSFPSTSSSSSSSPSGYISEPHNSDDEGMNDNDDVISMLDLSVSSLNSSAWRMDTIGEDDKETTQTNTNTGDVNGSAERNDADVESLTTAGDNTMLPPPVAVVFELDDYTDDSAAMGEDTLLQFVRDFTEEMKEEVFEPTRPSVRLYSTVGARTCDLKMMKQRVLSSETIVSTILDNRVKQHRQRMADRASSIASSIASACTSIQVDSLEEEGRVTDDEEMLSLPSNSSSSDEGPKHRRQFSKDFSSDDILSAMRGEDLLLDTRTATESSMTRLRDKKRANEEMVSKTLATTASIRRHRGAETSSSVSRVVRKGEQALAETLKEEAERRRQRIVNLRANKHVNTNKTIRPVPLRRPASRPTLPTALKLELVDEITRRRKRQSIAQNKTSGQAPIRRQDKMQHAERTRATPALRTNESISNGTRTTPSLNISTAKSSMSRRPVQRRSQSSASQPKKRNGLIRFIGRLTGTASSSKSTNAIQVTRNSKKETAREGYRRSVASNTKRSQYSQANYSTPSKRADRTVSSRVSNILPPQRRTISTRPHPIEGRDDGTFASALEPRKRFDDDSISYASALTSPSSMGQRGLRINCSPKCLEDIDVISYDELAASTALASASWV